MIIGDIMKTRMVLEGGSFRGLFTAGVLDVLMENNINIDEIVGVSAGAVFGVNFFSKQKGRVIRYNKRFCNSKRYMSILSLIFTGNYINRKFAFYDVTKKYDIFDNDEYIKTNKNFYAVATNIESGKPEYIKIDNPLEQLEVLRASSSVPLISRIVKLNNKKYLDGGISDSIPYKYNMDKYKKNIIILTQPLDYKKKPISNKKIKLINFKYKKYPKLIETMMNRYKNYNRTIREIIKLEEKGKVFVIRPSKSLDIKLSEKNPEKLQEIYDMGVKEGKKILKDLKKYLDC